jgi:hypothetical protein
MPMIQMLTYFLLTRIFGRKSVVNYYRCASECGVLAYMLALLTFRFEVIQLLLLVCTFSFVITDKLISLIMYCAKLNEYDIQTQPDKIAGSTKV